MGLLSVQKSRVPSVPASKGWIIVMVTVDELVPQIVSESIKYVKI